MLRTILFVVCLLGFAVEGFSQEVFRPRTVGDAIPLPLNITTTSPLPTILEDQPLADPFCFEVEGGTPPYENFAVASGTFPTGMTLNPTTGCPEGTPTDTNVYIFGITVDDQLGTLSPAKTFSWTVSPADADLPAPWVAAIIGNPSPACTESATELSDTFTLVGCGFTYGTTDSGHFIYQTVDGDFELVVNNSSCIGTGAFGFECGIMARQSIGTQVTYASCKSSDGGTYTEWRASQGGATDSATGTAATEGWLRLRVVGGVPDCDQSVDGSAWTDIPVSGSVVDGQPYLIGMWVDSNNLGTVTGVFSDVSVTELLSEGSSGYRPHLVGPGSMTRGGRGGGLRIGRVTSLASTASPTWAECEAGGTVKDCLQTPVDCDPIIGTISDCARYVLIDVSGIAAHTIGTSPGPNQMYVDAPYLTWAGQTAPVGTEGTCLANCGVQGTGLTISGLQIKINAHDQVFQHTMLMYTDWRGCGGTISAPPAYGNGQCGLGDYQWAIGTTGEELNTGGAGNGHIYNILLDHCGAIWNIAGTGAMAIGGGAHDIQIVDCLFGEPLNWYDASGSYSFQTDRYIDNVVLRQNLFTNSWGRNPTFGVGGNYFGTTGSGLPCGYPCKAQPWLQRLAWVNNYVYNGDQGRVWAGGGAYAWMSWVYRIDSPSQGATNQLDLVMVGNNFDAGPSSGTPYAGMAVTALASSISGGMSLYMHDNDDDFGAISAASGNGQFGGINLSDDSQGEYTLNAITGTGSNISIKSLSAPTWYTDIGFDLLANFGTTNLRTFVAANAGPYPANRNSEVSRMVGDISDGGGDNSIHPDSVSLPLHREAVRVCEVPDNPNTVADGAGRTRIEVWLEGILFEDDGDLPESGNFDGTPACGARRLEPAN